MEYERNYRPRTVHQDPIYDEDLEDYAFGRGNLSQKKIDLMKKL